MLHSIKHERFTHLSVYGVRLTVELYQSDTRHRLSSRAAEPHTLCPPRWQLSLTFVATRMRIRSLRTCAANYCNKPRTRLAP
jgi:hypothetical protein